jgi:hypothetical protein
MTLVGNFTLWAAAVWIWRSTKSATKIEAKTIKSEP